MKHFSLATLLSVMIIGAGSPMAADLPVGANPPIESDPACTWSKAPHGEWLCKGRFKLSRTEGDPPRLGYCGTIFKAGTVIVTSFSVQMAAPQDPSNPFYLDDLYIDRSQVEATQIGGRFRSDIDRPDDVYCNFSARIRIK